MKSLATARLSLGAAVLLVMLASNPALAFRMIQNTSPGRTSFGTAVACSDPGGFVHWTNPNIAFSYNPANQGAGKGAALAAAALAWTNVVGAPQVMTVAGTTNAGFATDGANTVVWATGNGCTGGCLAITALVLSAGQVITETDVSFNDAFAWATNGSDYDTQSIATHEFGHCLGLHHTELKKAANRPTMYASYFGTGARTLENDDIQGLQCAQNHYPMGAAQFVAAVDHSEGGAVPALTLAARPRVGGAVLRFGLVDGADVRLELYDVAGRLLTTLVNGYRGPGEYEVAWDGASSAGQAPSGIYFARIETPNHQAHATVILAE